MTDNNDNFTNEVIQDSDVDEANDANLQEPQWYKQKLENKLYRMDATKHKIFVSAKPPEYVRILVDGEYIMTRIVKYYRWYPIEHYVYDMEVWELVAPHHVYMILRSELNSMYKNSILIYNIYG